MQNYDPLSGTADEILEGLDTRTVKNQFPFLKSTPYKIAIIGEAPGKDEIEQGKPFVGWSGKDLDRYLSRFSILRDACFIGNMCQHRPPRNQIAQFDWLGPEIQGGIAQLKRDLANTERPNLVICLGGSALHIFKNPNYIPKKHKDKDGWKFVYPDTIGDWRGSFFEAHQDSPLPGVKCMGSYHPAACMRQYEWTPYLLLDISRAAKQSLFPYLTKPIRQLRARLSFEETLNELDKLILGTEPFGTDIEGYWNYFRCISFAPAEDYAFIVPFITMSGDSFWSVREEAEILRRVAKLLRSPRSRKVWQNGLYDRFALQYGQSMVCGGNNHDIMLMHWELHSELEKALSVQASIYTDEPFYKGDYKSNSQDEFYRYCCTDSAVTIEIYHKLKSFLPPTSTKHAKFNETLLNALLYMELRGIRYDAQRAASRLREVEHAIFEQQTKLDKIAGMGLPTLDKTILRAILRDTMCYKRDASRVKKEYTEDYDICMRILLGEADLTPTDQGRLSIALDKSLNIKGKGIKDYLYRTLALPVQRDPKTDAETTDYGALITLRKKSNHPALPLIIDLTELRTRAQDLRMSTDPDGRIRSALNEVGSETGRVTSGKSPTGSGKNLQTIPDKNELKPESHPLHTGMRDMCVADPGCYLAKLDLKGADGWTIGANLASLGDSTMLEDLRFGLKPAHFPCFARRHGNDSIRNKTRPEFAQLFKEIKKSDWDYFAAKQCTWGFFYLMGLAKAASHIFEVSEGTVNVTEDDMALFKNVLFHRYNAPLWHRAMERRLFNQPYPPKLLSPSGHLREFFGRKTEIVGQALAHEPQSVTTYAINLGVYNCWMDPENRYKVNGRTKLKVEPLHQVHDEAVFQFLIADAPWAITKIKSWFNNVITIAGINLVIPFEGAYGTDWSMDEKAKVGDI